MNAKSKTQKTDNFGEALFNLFLISGTYDFFYKDCKIIIIIGKPGKYKISFSTNENSVKTLSSSFELINPIQSVQLIRDLTQTIEVILKIKKIWHFKFF